jgi:hypothetical protein
VLAVLSSDSGHYRQAYEGFQEEWGSSVPYALSDAGMPSSRPDAIVAFGSRAALADWPAATLLETCLAPGARAQRRGGELLRVAMLPAPGPLLDRIQRLLPGIKSLRVLWSSDFENEDAAELAAAARTRGLVVYAEKIDDPAELPQRLRRFAGKADALWLMPDPALVNALNFATLREYAAAARVPFLAPTEGLAEKGATATVAASFRDMGRAAAAALKTRLRGGAAPGLVHPETLVVTVNATAAKEVGFSMQSAGGVDRTIP